MYTKRKYNNFWNNHHMGKILFQNKKNKSGNTNMDITLPSEVIYSLQRKKAGENISILGDLFGSLSLKSLVFILGHFSLQLRESSPLKWVKRINQLNLSNMK